MPMTRRQFAAAAGSAIALTVLGCSDSDSPLPRSKRRHQLKLPDEPFTVGPPDQYLKPKVYQTYRESHGIWLVSDAKMLVALSAVCTHNACGTRYDSTSNLFKCPCHESIFSIEGLNRSGSKAKRPLERCRIELVGKRGDGDAQIQVDPTRRFRQEIDNKLTGRNWSSPHSVYFFDEADS